MGVMSIIEGAYECAKRCTCEPIVMVRIVRTAWWGLLDFSPKIVCCLVLLLFLGRCMDFVLLFHLLLQNCLLFVNSFRASPGKMWSKHNV
jgi:hypothetical protein